MRQPDSAIARWVIQHDVFVFYGNGGVFQGDAFARWFAALQDATNLRLCVGGAGAVFSFDPKVRARGTEFFKRRKLPFAVVTDNTMARMLGTTARMVGMDLQIYSWSQSERPFLKLGLEREVVTQLNRELRELRNEIDEELRKLGRV